MRHFFIILIVIVLLAVSMPPASAGCIGHECAEPGMYMPTPRPLNDILIIRQGHGQQNVPVTLDILLEP